MVAVAERPLDSVPAQGDLFDSLEGCEAPLVAPKGVVDPSRLRLERVETEWFYRRAVRSTRLTVRPAPGRKMAYVLRHGPDLIGLLFLASPVIALAARDAGLALPTDPSKRGRALRRYMDLSICVGIQPLAWHWNLGKLVALLAASADVAADFRTRYGEDLIGITTMGGYGRSSQYNRIYRFFGYTSGYGHHHITEEEYRRMLAWMVANDVPIPRPRMHEGSNFRMERIRAYIQASGDKIRTFHGNRRGVYFRPVDARPVDTVIAEWHVRWGRPRWERTKDQTAPYAHGLETPEKKK